MTPVRPERVLVVLPTYNEAASILDQLRRLTEVLPAARVLVVDDSSPDGTGDLVSEITDTLTTVSLMRRPHKQGLGRAYRAGLAWGLQHGYEVLVQMDADGSHLPEQVPQLLAALERADVAIGSRYVSGGRIASWPLPREVMSRVANGYVRALTGLAPHDVTAGFRAYRAAALRRLDVDEVGSQGYCFQIEMTRRAAAAGLRTVEVPITFVERSGGSSKMSATIVAEAVVRTTLWGVQDRLTGLRLT